MENVRQFALLSIAVVAVLRDLREGRIPNRLIVIGLVCGAVWQFAAAGQAGLVLFAGGCVLPVLLFGGLYYFRMFGAGDIKLLCVLGGFLGPMDGFRCIAVSVFFGGCIALAILMAGGGLRERLGYLAGYLFEYAADGQWRSYMAGVRRQDRFCFSVPVLLGVLCYIGGFL